MIPQTDRTVIPENFPTGHCQIPCQCAELRRTIAAHRKDLLRVEVRILVLEAALAQCVTTAEKREDAA